jgi:hypothetical protein
MNALNASTPCVEHVLCKGVHVVRLPVVGVEEGLDVASRSLDCVSMCAGKEHRSGRGVKLPTHLRLEPRPAKSGATQVFPLCALTSWARTDLPPT